MMKNYNASNQPNNSILKPASTSVQLDGFAPAITTTTTTTTTSGVLDTSSSSTSSSSTVEKNNFGGDSVASSTTSTSAAVVSATSAIATLKTKCVTKKRGPQSRAGGGDNGGISSKKNAMTTTAGVSSSSSSSSSTAATTTTCAENISSSDFMEETTLQPLSEIGFNFQPLSLPQIQLRILNLLEQLPKDLPMPILLPPPNEVVEDDVNYYYSSDCDNPRYKSIKSFASRLQTTIEEYNLLISLVSSATYRWGVDCSGASQQNLAVMSAELQQCQDIISNVVSSRLSNVLCPAVDILIGEVEVIRGEGMKDEDDGGGGGSSSSIVTNPASKRIKLNDNDDTRIILNNNSGLAAVQHASRKSSIERRINRYTHPQVDPAYVHLCHCILARNAPLIRHAVATSIHTAHRVIGDYLTAMKKDTSHDVGKGGYY